jgi:inhibitor of cysteine peptidase
VTITGADDRHTVRLARGGILTIKLDVQFGTGFIWRVEHNDAHLLVPLGQPETERRGEGKPGTVEVQVFRFRAEAAGKTTLALAYAHPWEKDVKPAKTFGIMVEIH